MVDKERYILCRQKIGRYFPYFLWPITIKSTECLAGIGGRQSIRHITTDLLWIRKSNPIIFCTYSSSRHSASPLSLSPHSLSCYFMYWGTVLQLWCSLSRTKVRRGQTRSTASQQKPINPPMLFSFIIIIMNPQ